MEETLYQHLHKLSGTKSEEAIEEILETLWKTRKTGLSTQQKSHLQSLLSLPSLQQVDPVLACLRSLIRKSVHENFSGDDILKLFPPDLSLDLQSLLILLFQKYQNQWKEDLSREEYPLPGAHVSYQVKANVPLSFTPLPPSETPASLWPRQDDSIAHFNNSDLVSPTPNVVDNNVSCLAPISLQRDVGPLDNLGILPRLKSMTWTMEKRNLAPANRVAFVSLKLQDYTKSPLGETEVKFQLTRDTLEGMLRSMTYISEQLSNTRPRLSFGADSKCAPEDEGEKLKVKVLVKWSEKDWLA
ncbi:uncharacterized protein LOC117920991 isoform X2 [Vitis riparia]|uniref:uncharacterized protein LOC117920991 isoform X2 n=1 Tax=Vitis riparia TaxID=96939 RepID=UPI00155AC816|nr:uncharacterized protein LOC117920991 isoform X2 [Vitis riparia]